MKSTARTLFAAVSLVACGGAPPVEADDPETETGSPSTTTGTTTTAPPTEADTSTSTPEDTVDASTDVASPTTTDPVTTQTTTDPSTTSTTTDPSTTSDTSSTTDTSTTDVQAVCGDGQVDPGEACDDGNSEPTDGCTATCELAICGDGVVQAGVDVCDDGNTTNNDACSNKCRATPTAVTLTAGTNTNQAGNANGGTAYNDPCGAGRALIGFAGSFMSYHRRIRGVCGLLGLSPAMDGFNVTLTDPVQLPERGPDGNTPWMRTCPQDQVIVGFSGRSGGLVDSLTFTCAPLVVDEADDGTWTIALGATSNLLAVGGNGGNQFPQTDCPAGQVATVQRLRTGDGLDAFGLGCSAVGLDF